MTDASGKSRLLVIGLGGTIAMAGSGEVTPTLSAQQLVDAVPGLRADGFDVPPPRRFHGSWTFYFRAPGGFTIEVLC